MNFVVLYVMHQSYIKIVEKKCRASQLNVEPIINKEDDDRNLKDGAQFLKTCAHQLDLVEQPQKHHRKLVQLNRWMLQDFTTRSLNPTSQLKLGMGRLDVLVTVRVYKPFGGVSVVQLAGTGPRSLRKRL